MTFYPLQRSIWYCKMDLEGRKNSCPFRCLKNALPINKRIKQGETEPTNHWFVVISKKVTQGFLTVLPITSQSYQEGLNDGEPLHYEDIEDSEKSKNVFEMKKDTLVLCNKPCRIPVENMNENDDWGRIKEDRYGELIRITESCIELN